MVFSKMLSESASIHRHAAKDEKCAAAHFIGRKNTFCNQQTPRCSCSTSICHVTATTELSWNYDFANAVAAVVATNSLEIEMFTRTR